MSTERTAGSSARVPRAEVRERLIAAAATVFAERGINDARLDDVAAAAGFSKGAVYSNFASKDALVAAVIGRGTTSVLQSLQRTVLPKVAGSDLPEVVRAAFAPFDQNAQFELLAEFRAYAIRHPEVLPDFIAQRTALQEGVLQLVHAWFAAHPEADPGVPLDQLATALVAANVGIAFDWPVLDGTPPGEIISGLVAGLLRPRAS